MVEGGGALDAVLRTLARRRRVEDALRAALRAEGYCEVAIPLLQPAEPGEGWGASYRVLDHEGALLELRPDMTLPVARLCAAGDVGGPRPRRLCYVATLFRRGADGPRELVQAGAERIGGAGDPEDADAETVALCARCLEAAGLRRYLLALGDVGYVRETLEGQARAAEAEEALRRRDLVAVAACGGPAASLLWRGTVGEALAGGLRVSGPAGRRLLRVLDALRALGLAGRVLVEPGLVPPGRYYTGLVFEALVPGQSAAVGDGGRYDDLLARWGRPEPAVGFALDCDRLLAAGAGEDAAGAR